MKIKVWPNVALVTVVFLLICSCDQTPNKEAPELEDHRTKVEMATTHGTMTLALYDETPLHRDNFIDLIQKKAYD
ncbi:MAG: peptidylprolyl isomerase, partial [Marinirhabdus sp.]|nr:peptidylprolyl isomerase [Marinirhabdus sp.]